VAISTVPTKELAPVGIVGLVTGPTGAPPTGFPEELVVESIHQEGFVNVAEIASINLESPFVRIVGRVADRAGRRIFESKHRFARCTGPLLVTG